MIEWILGTVGVLAVSAGAGIALGIFLERGPRGGRGRPDSEPQDVAVDPDLETWLARLGQTEETGK